MAYASDDISNNRFQFQAMNTTMEITVGEHEEGAEHFHKLAVDWFRFVEERFSRFQEKSELSHLNRLAGETCLVSETMLEVLQLADSYRLLTDGIFNPLIYPAMLQSGYDRTFDDIKGSHLHPTMLSSWPPVSEAASLTPVIQPAMRSIRLPAQSGLDLGGIVKGWAVKRLAHYFQETLRLQRGIINAGGDLTVWGGAAEKASPWSIDIEHPWQEAASIGRIFLTEGSVATSSKLGRSWSTNYGIMHHLIDPRTMRPSESDVVQCTVSGGTDSDSIACEIWAKVLCILGVKDGLALMKRKIVPYEALLFTQDHQVHFYGHRSSLGSVWRGITPEYTHIHPTMTIYPRYEGGIQG